MFWNKITFINIFLTLINYREVPNAEGNIFSKILFATPMKHFDFLETDHYFIFEWSKSFHDFAILVGKMEHTGFPE